MALVAGLETYELRPPEYPLGGTDDNFLVRADASKVPYPVKMEPNLVVEFYSR